MTEMRTNDQLLAVNLLPVAVGADASVPALSHAPLVSVILLTCNRPTEASRSLRSILDQDYPNKEVIVVENSSRGELRHLAQSAGENVQLVELSENQGACAGRNAGLCQTRGEFLVTLDDDVVLDSPDSLSAVVRLLAGNPDLGAVAFWVGDPGTGKLSIRDWCHPRPYWTSSEQPFPTYYLTEGAMALRKQALDSAGLYDERFFIAGEGHDLAMRILDRGFRILFSPEVRTWHYHSAQGRRPQRPYYFMTRNYLWIAFKDYPWPANIRFLLPKLAMMAWFACRTGQLSPFVRGLVDGIRGLREIWATRTPVRPSTVRYLTEQDSLRPSYWARLRRHHDSPLL